MLRLYTFNLSHFSEKARWALDYEGLRYEEKILVPGPHQLTTRRLARRSHVPILEHDGRVVQGSSAILDYIAEQLGGRKLAPSGGDEGRVRTLEQEADLAFGLGVQRVVYSVLLQPQHRHLVVDLWSENGPSWARPFYGVAMPAISKVVQRMYKTTDAQAVARAQERFSSAMDVLDGLLTSAPYLGGRAPSRLDITVASLLGPICRPPQHHVRWPEIPAELAGFETQLQGRPTWNHVLRMYRDHRRSVGS